MLFTIELEDEFTGENVEELRGVLVEVALFGGAGRHALFDHAEIYGAMEMPAIARLRAADAGPGVVLGVVDADGHLFTLDGATKNSFLKLRAIWQSNVFALTTRSIRHTIRPEEEYRAGSSVLSNAPEERREDSASAPASIATSTKPISVVRP